MQLAAQAPGVAYLLLGFAKKSAGAKGLGVRKHDWVDVACRKARAFVVEGAVFVPACASGWEQIQTGKEQCRAGQ